MSFAPERSGGVNEVSTKFSHGECDLAKMGNLEVAVACISSAAYDFSDVPGWNRISEFVEQDGRGADKMSIYERQGVCALAISGSDDLKDWTEDADFIRIQACGLTLHRGFYSEMARLTNTINFGTMMQTLTSKSCKKVILVGHSLGGAIMGTIAACVVAKTEKQLDGLRVDGLYTFGAPGIAHEDGGIASDNGKCFKGTRFYRQDRWGGGDPVPAVTEVIGLRHPKMTAVRIKGSWLGTPTRVTHDCEDTETPRLPKFGLTPRPLLHRTGEYISNVNQIQTSASGM